MSSPLATRCPSCQTVFRVVRDQLRVSGGWVRCGRCAEVFNAAEALLNLDTGLPWTPQDQAQEQAELAARSPTGSAVAAPAPALARVPVSSAPATKPPASAAPVSPAPLSPPAVGKAARPTDSLAVPGNDLDEVAAAAFVARFGSGTEDRSGPASLLGPEAGVEPKAAAKKAPASTPPVIAPPSKRVEPTAWTEESEPTRPLAPPQSRHPGGEHSDTLPSFVKAADRAQRWRQPLVRTGLAVAALLGILVLATQIAFSYRDLLAARLPASQPVLQAGCALLGCTVGPALAINSLVVESSGLLRLERSNRYRLQVALRNRAGIPVAIPAIDITLTDTQGEIITRKVLMAADLGSTINSLQAGQLTTLQAVLLNTAQATDPGAEAIAGYTVELFYP